MGVDFSFQQRQQPYSRIGYTYYNNNVTKAL